MSFNFNPCSSWNVIIKTKIRVYVKKTCWDNAYYCYVFVNLQAVAAGSLINLATVLYLNSIRVSCSHPASLFFPCGDITIINQLSGVTPIA